MHNLSALVVDDSKVGRLTMMKKLEAMGLQVALAESGQEAIDYLAQHHPDVIFMDHMMPEMDGFEVTRRLKASPATRDIPVIVISGNDEASFVAQARAAGAIDAITKPPASDVLENLLTTLPLASVALADVPALSPEPESAATLDMAAMQESMQQAVHAEVARLLEGAVTALRDTFKAEIDQRQAAEAERQRQTFQDWEAGLAQQAASLAQVRTEGAAEAERLAQRLQSLEALVAKPQPGLAEFQADVKQQIASGLAGLQTQTGGLTTQLQSLRQGLEALQTSAGETDSQVKHQMDAWNDRLSVFADEQAQIRDKLRRFAIATAVGGGLLLIALGVAVFGG